jgi:ATP-dependent helicase Lhr and Lhr-like helicase
MMTSTFARFPPRLQQAIAARLGWTELRPVQELAGQGILDPPFRRLTQGTG